MSVTCFIGASQLIKFSFSLSKKGLKVKVTAILNDVTATLASGHLNDPDCLIGFALGSGLNISYVEQTNRILNWTENRPFGYEEIEYMDINTEFCALGDSGSLDLIKSEISISLFQKLS